MELKDRKQKLKDFLLSVEVQAEQDEPARVDETHKYGRDQLLSFEDAGLILIDETKDTMTLTAHGRIYAGLRPEGVPDLGAVKLKEVTGNVEEAELAARYVETKVAGVDRHIKDDPNNHFLKVISVILEETSNELRMGMHLPEIHISGRVIPYNDDNDTGVSHEAALRVFCEDIHARNERAGWWTDIKTGEPAVRGVAELLLLVISEVIEAYVSYVEHVADDKLPQYPGLGVELGDSLIRLGDFGGALLRGKIVHPDFDPTDIETLTMMQGVVNIIDKFEKYRKRPMDQVQAAPAADAVKFLPACDIAEMTDKKLAFNASRADHKIENRLKDGGKKS